MSAPTSLDNGVNANGNIVDVETIPDEHTDVNVYEGESLVNPVLPDKKEEPREEDCPPVTNATTVNDEHVSVTPPSRKKSYVVIAVSCCLVAIISGFMVRVLINPSKWSTKTTPKTMMTTTTTTTTTTTKPVYAESWHDPYLPLYAKPVLYDLWLYPDFYRNGMSFTGRENITINVLQDTNEFLVHCKDMNISDVQMRLPVGTPIQVNNHSVSTENQYLVVQTKETIRSGSTVILHLKFAGPLSSGRFGHMKSTYTNALTGKTR